MTTPDGPFRPFLKGRQLLQRVRWAGGPPGAEALYQREIEPGRFSSATYQNIFHKRRWSWLTGLSDFALEIQGRGPGKIELYSLVLGQKPALDRRLSLSPPGFKAFLPLNQAGDFFFFHWLPSEPGAAPPLAGYTAEARPSYAPAKVALGITTFERNDDLRRLVAAYRQSRLADPQIGLEHLLVVNNQIDDAAKLADIEGDGVTLINNPYNTGGAGGFGLVARWAVEARQFSHVLFMDDDIIIDPEAWFRTLSLTRNLKPEYRGQVIGGGMFSRENPVRCHTLFEAVDEKGRHKNVSGSWELTGLEIITQTLERGQVDWGAPAAAAELPRSGLRPYAAWWYCLWPLEVFHQHGFPLPLFFRGDDIEMGLRASRKVLWLNGICVWHPDFKSKSSPLRTYLSFRNHLINLLLHFQEGRFLALKKYFRRLARALAANDYERAALAVMSLTDCARLPLKPQTAPEINRRLTEILTENRNKAAGPPGAEPKAPRFKARKTGLLGSFGDTALVLMTLGGALIPGFLFRPGPIEGPLAYIRGRFPARRSVYDQQNPPLILEFNRLLALRLAAAGLKAGFLFPLRARALKNLRAPG